MSCLNGTECLETQKRRRALAVLGLMAILFLILSVWSFLPSRGQVVPGEFSHRDVGAVEGKRVFQAYNCMGCHTIVGNGAYLGPDLTRVYADTGPAWLAAFLPSANGWPTASAVKVQIAAQDSADDTAIRDIDAYRTRYPGAAERMDHRGGQDTLMPTLPLDAHETAALIAFLKYMSAMNTEGWPPRPHPDRRVPAAASVSAATSALPAVAAAPSAAAVDPAEADPAVLGKQLVADYGCVACHSADEKRVVGPGWGGLYGSQVTLADGSKKVVDEDYLQRALREPSADVPEGYPAGVMPSYDESLMSDADLQAIIAYLSSL
ncbi:MAG: cytochrome c [Castellaniella sp.]